MLYPPVPLGTTDFRLKVQVLNASGVASAADSNDVDYVIYAQDGTIKLSGSFSTTVQDSKTGFYQTANLAITAANGFAAGQRYDVGIEYVLSSAVKRILQQIWVT